MSIANAKARIKNLKEVFVLPNTGHGIETSRQAISILAEVANR